MNRLKKIICAALATVVVLACFTACEEKKEIDVANITLSKDQLNDVNKKIGNTLGEAKYSGGVFVKLNKNVLYEKYFGIEDPETKKEVDENTRYQVSSLTKNITGTAILQLADEGKLSLDDSLDQYFDASGKRAYLKDITIKDLVDLEVSFGAYNINLLKDDAKREEIRKLIMKNGDLKGYITDFILDFGIDSGSNQAHSNYYLLGVIIEKVTSESYKDYIQKNIYNKVNMKNSTVVNKDQPMHGYNVDTKKWRNEKLNMYYNNYEFMFSSFCAVSTVRDMYKFYNAIMQNKLTKTNLIKKIEDFVTNFGFGFRHDGHNLYSYSGTSLHTSYAYLNDETKEFVILCSNQIGNIRLNATGKAVYNAVNSKINGMLLAEE
ncbi:MAG: beta-lactamase family protein [Ruminococcus sp.]|nr:beta-lactamase family protein [Ruminococcus sp.]